MDTTGYGAAHGPELVHLCDVDGTVTGTAPKSEVHTTDTALHRAFSCYVLDAEERVLLTRRSLAKATWPGVWTNTVCGHPGPAESDTDAISRRLAQELGVTLPDGAAPALLLPTFTYRATDASGLVEHEFCPVHVVRLPRGARLTLDPDPDEVVETRWWPLADVRAAVAAAPFAFSPWMGLQLASWHEGTA